MPILNTYNSYDFVKLSEELNLNIKIVLSLTDCFTYCIKVKQDTCNRLEEPWHVVNVVIDSVCLGEEELFAALNKFYIHEVNIFRIYNLARLSER